MTDQQVIVSRPNRALALPNTPDLAELFPEAKVLEGKYLIVKHGLAEYRILRGMGYRVPNPLICYYDWNGGTPFDVQRVTCSMLTASPRAYVLNSFGTGKSRCVLWSWHFLKSYGYCNKLLIVAPLSVAKREWPREIMEVLPGVRYEVLHASTKKQREKKLNDPAVEIFIINHDGIKVLHSELEKRTDIDVLALDELAQAYRRPSIRAKYMAKFAASKAWVWGLTGGPMPNEPTDVWMQCRVVTPHTVPLYRTHARDLLMIRKSDIKWVAKPDAEARAYSWMQPAVRFSLDDVVELPETITRPINVPSTKAQDKYYNEIANLFYSDTPGGGCITADNAAIAWTKMLQVAGGYVYKSDKTIFEIDCTPRKEELRDLIHAASAKVIVFFPFKHMLAGVSKFIDNGDEKDDQNIEHAVVNGDISANVRNKIFADFQTTNRYRAILAHPACMSHGLTLTSAATIIWWAPIPDYDIYSQANARIRRIGQTLKQQIIHLQSMPIERKIYALLKRKERVQDSFLDLFERHTENAQQTGGN